MVRHALASFAALVIACGGDTGDPKVGECEDYCDLITAHCSAEFAQYGDRNTCLASCQAMPLGDPETHSGNTIACRTFQAAAAERDRTLCAGAGPGGAGACGSDCESFCAMAAEICTGELEVYATDAECMTACAAFTTMTPFDVSDIAGNTRECRIYHLTAASVLPATHCPHIAPISITCQ